LTIRAVSLECFGALLDIVPNQRVFSEAQCLIRRMSAEITEERLRAALLESGHGLRL
jgi:hypothetical protein